MRDVVVSNYVTVDGRYAGPDGDIDWFVWNDETEEYSRGMIESIDTILFGRVTCELMADYWPTEAAADGDSAITEAMNTLPKVVLSKTLEELVQSLANRGPVDEYRLLVNPVVLRDGKRMFDGVETRVDLELVDSRTFSNGVVLLDYRTTAGGADDADQGRWVK